jgi:pantothenate kinase
MSGLFMWQELNQKGLTLDQTSTPLHIDRQEVEQFYHPLALELIKRGGNQKRLLAAIAGPPGSGKTAFATLLVAVINVELKSEGAVMISQDGWHYPDAYLDTHNINYHGEDIPLSQVKGSPETYDTRAALECLERIKVGESLNYPVYSRVRHEPIQDAGAVRLNHRWIILEGNYWLLQESAWQPFQALFDFTIFLTADPDTLVEGLRQRHLRGEKDPASIEKHIKMVDMPNINRVLAHSNTAQVEVEKKNSQQIAGIKYHEASG